MKTSWRKSRENLMDKDDNHGDDDNSNGRRGGRGQKRNLSVGFDLEENIIQDTFDEPLSADEIKTRWYQKDDYGRFKKDTVLNSFNYLNARRASKPFDETTVCIRGIEDICSQDTTLRPRLDAEKKYVYKVIRDEQGRQRKEQRQKQKREQQNQATVSKYKNRNSAASSASSYPDLDKYRSVSLIHTKDARDRAHARGIEYARAQQRMLGVAKPSSMKNLFKAARRTQSTAMIS